MMFIRKLHQLSIGSALLALLFVANQTSAATFEVTATEWGDPADVSSMAWAVDQANKTPGKDIINIASGLKIDVGIATPAIPNAKAATLAHFTESVEIRGNGATLVGNPGFVTSAGDYATKDNIVRDVYDQAIQPTDTIVTQSYVFAQIGSYGADNSAIEIEIQGLNGDGLIAIANVYQGATLTIKEGRFENIVNYSNRTAGVPAIQAFDGSTLNLVNFELHRNFPFFSHYPSLGGDAGAVAWGGAISGSNAYLNMQDSVISESYPIGAINWTGTANIVSSVISGSGGLFLDDGTLNFINSILYLGQEGEQLTETTRVIAQGAGAKINIIASTILYDALYTEQTGCAETKSFSCLGSPITATLGGIVDVRQSAVLPINLEFNVSQQPYHAREGGSFRGDDYSFIAAAGDQDSDDVKALFGNQNLITGGLAFDLINDGVAFFNALPGGATPAPGGVLIEGVPSAGPGQSNELLSPINGQPILNDVYGSPRVYANGTRNIGAVQNPDAPILAAKPGDSEVTLNWSPTANGVSNGFWICFSPTPLADPLIGACPGTEDATASGNATKVVYSGLTNGSPYWFALRDQSSIWSNVVTATPLGPIGVAQPTAVTVGDSSLQVYWDEPSTLGGHTGLLSYGVLYRPLGTQGWSRGPQGLTAQTTLLQGLVNGTTYEIGVFAQTDDGGATAVLGTITGTPQAAPTLAYAEPPSWPQNSPLTLIPGFTQLQGSGTYSMESGALPDGITLNPTNGFISGTPTTQQSTSATIRLTDGATGLFAEATVALNIVAPSPVPELHYPTIQATVGTPASATPATANIPVGATYSVVGGSSLPGDFTIAPSTGVISGSPTSAPGQILNVDIQACWDGCDPNAGEVRITTMSFYILPRMQYPITSTATAGVPVSISPTVDLWSGGVFSISAGSLPDGLSLDPTTGVISGTPQAEIDTQVTVSYSTGISVGGLESVTSSPHIKVVPPTIALTYPFIKGTLGQYLSVPPNVSGLTDIPTYTLVAGSLPQGLSLDPASGAITGTPNGLSGTFQVIIEVTNRYGTARSGALIEIGEVVESIAVPALSGFGLSVLALLTLGLGLFGMRRIT